MTTKSFKFFQAAVLLSTALTVFGIGDAEWEAMRARAIGRPRQVIWNGDCDDMVAYPVSKPVTPEGFIENRLIYTKDDKIDTISYSPTSCFADFTCKGIADEYVREVIGDGKHYNATKDFFALGTDSLTMAVDFCRQQNKEIFVSLRMNDTHDAGSTAEKLSPQFPDFKRNHPECLFGAPGSGRPPFCSWTAVDYANPLVRDTLKASVRRLCEKYDIDGVEMDFFRHAQLFKTVAWGGVATDEELAMMTQLMAEVRQICEAAGRRRGRPILVAIRVPDSVEYCRAMGIDLEAWLRDGSVDLLMTTGYFVCNPVSYSVELARRYGVKCYLSLDESRISLNELPVPSRKSREAYFARALSALEAGVDGVYYFNMYGMRAADIPRGKRSDLEFLDKAYYVSYRGQGGYRPDNYLKDGFKYRNVRPVDNGAPAPFPVEFDIVIGDDLEQAAALGAFPAINVYAQATLPAEVTMVLDANGVKCNAVKVTDCGRDDIFRFEVANGVLHEGANHFKVTADGAPPKATLRDFCVYLKYPAVPSRKP